MSKLVSPPGRGILPLAKSVSVFLGRDVGRGFVVDQSSIWTMWGFEWAMPGQGDSYDDCGEFGVKGCLHVEDHHGVIFEKGEDGLKLRDIEGKVYVKMFKRTCLRAECPVCYEKWAGKEAHAIEERFRAWRGRGKVIHVVVSPSEKDVIDLSFGGLRRKVYDVLEDVNVWGGSCIFHPFRQRENGVWFWSPHFHILGLAARGFVSGSGKMYEESGWVVKNLGVRKSVVGTAQYQLSHCGIHENRHTVSWFGCMSYHNLIVPEKEVDSEKCPACGRYLVSLRYVGEGGLLEKEGEYWLKPDDWIEKRPDYGMFSMDEELQRVNIMNIDQILLDRGF